MTFSEAFDIGWKAISGNELDETQKGHGFKFLHYLLLAARIWSAIHDKERNPTRRMHIAANSMEITRRTLHCKITQELGLIREDFVFGTSFGEIIQKSPPLAQSLEKIQQCST